MTDAIIEANEARRELHYTEAAFQSIRDAMVSRLLKTGINEDDARRALVLTIQSLDLVRDRIEQVVRDGEAAQALAEHAANLAAQGFETTP